MSKLSNRIQELQKTVAPAKLLVVTKNQPARKIRELLQSGVVMIGENRLQEIEKKFDLNLFRECEKRGVKLHFLGQLQSNKLPKIIRLCDVIESVDKLEHAGRINSLAAERNKIMEIFVQLNLTDEPQKAGAAEAQLTHLIERIRNFSNVKLLGLMTIGKQGDGDATRRAFRRCAALAKEYGLQETSMGMSEDYASAIEEGATIVRLGSLVFGADLGTVEKL